MVTKINSNNILAAFNKYNAGFNAAIRYIFELSKANANKVPAAPEKSDKSTEAKNLRAEIKKIENRNAIIADAKRIVETFAITANDVKDKGISALRAKIIERVPNVDENGKPVKFAKLPSYLKNEIKDYATTLQVVPATWIEAICAATDNVEGKKNEYILTTPPVIEDGMVEDMPHGDLVNAKGYVLSDDKKYNIFEVWEREAKINNIANAAGRATVQQTKTELKAK